MKVYAKNPAGIGELIIDNPAPKKKVKKDPRRVAAGKQSWKTRQQKQKRENPKRMKPDYAKTGKSMVVKAGLLAVGTFGAVRGTQYLLDKFGQNLPAVVRNYGPIVVPGVIGVVIGTKAKQKNVLAQSTATGMVLASVNGAINKILPKSQEGLSGALGFENNSMLADGDMIVTPDGRVLDQNRNEFGNAVLQLEETTATPSVDAFSFEMAEDFENGENY